jgi:ribosomal protein L34E
MCGESKREREREERELKKTHKREKRAEPIDFCTDCLELPLVMIAGQELFGEGVHVG